VSRFFLLENGTDSWLRHVAKTDDIKDFVITEESSIAKGIRRVVAVTGHEAHDVSRKSSEFARKLDSIESSQGKDKETAMKAFVPVRFPQETY